MYTINHLHELMAKKPESVEFANGCKICFDPFDNANFITMAPDGQREIVTYSETNAEVLFKWLESWNTKQSA